MFRAAEEMLRTEGKSLDQAKGPMYDQTKYGPVQQQKLEPALRRLTYPAEDGFGRGHGGQNRGSFFLSDFSILFSYLTCESRF